MPKILIPQVAFLFFTLLLVSLSFGSNKQCEPITMTESPDLYNQIEGSVEPENLPGWLKYQMFVVMYDIYASELVQELSPRDHEILNNLSAENEHWQVLENARYENEFLNLCTNNSNLDTVTFAREYERIAAERNIRLGARTQQAIESLSSLGRKTIERFIEERITPDLSFPRTNSVDDALKDPENARFNLEIMCYMQINGKPPPELQEAAECLKEQTVIEPDGNSLEEYDRLNSGPQN